MTGKQMGRRDLLKYCLTGVAGGIVTSLHPRFTSAAATQKDILVAASNATVESRMQASWVCDGVDDQIEIQSALAYLSTCGGTLVLSEGTFNTSAPINLPFTYIGQEAKGILLEGKGWSATIIIYSGADYAIRGVNDTYGSAHTLQSMRIFAPSGGGIYLKYASYGAHSIIRDVYIGDIIGGSAMAGVGIYINASQYASLENIFVFNCATGIIWHATNEGSIRNIQIQNCVDGILFTESRTTTFQGVVQDCSRYGIRFGHSDGVPEGAGESITIIGSHFEANAGAALQFEYGAVNTVVVGTYIDSAPLGINITAEGGSIFSFIGLHLVAAGGTQGLVIGTETHKVSIMSSLLEGGGSHIIDNSSDLVVMNSLPNTDPMVKGQLYYIGATGVVMRSTG